MQVRAISIAGRYTYQQETLSQADMLRRVVQHISEKHFRMIRYFGFLANRVCGQYLPKVYEALKMGSVPAGGEMTP
ncbi:hypothetical protein PSTH1771_16760 [Pseudomonas syringae pv. theae]|nr:hypothetical protein PSTH1771_16760 [Pseudomonas syringae pv. theae]